jgi:hypothetical protein
VNLEEVQKNENIKLGKAVQIALKWWVLMRLCFDKKSNEIGGG